MSTPIRSGSAGARRMGARTGMDHGLYLAAPSDYKARRRPDVLLMLVRPLRAKEPERARRSEFDAEDWLTSGEYHGCGACWPVRDGARA